MLIYIYIVENFNLVEMHFLKNALGSRTVIRNISVCFIFLMFRERTINWSCCLLVNGRRRIVNLLPFHCIFIFLKKYTYIYNSCK